MNFTTILVIVIIDGYVILYIGMIAYDLFFKKDLTALTPKPEDEDIDISDEAGKFQPILIEKERPVKQQEERPVVDEPPEPPNKSEVQAQEDKPPIEEATSEATADEALHAESYHGSEDKGDDDDQPRNRKPLTEESSSDLPSANTQKSNVNVSSNPEHVKELIANLRNQQEPENSSSEEAKVVQPTVTPATEETNTEDYRSVLHMRVHINEEARHTRFSDFMTADQLSDEVKKVAEDPDELALREIENGWRLIRIEKENEELEEMMANGQFANDVTPNVSIGKLSKE